MYKSLGIVICNFNKVDYLKGCLESLHMSNFEGLSHDVIVVDNASTDGSVQFIKENYKDDVILLENKTNTGGSGGFDRGIKFCLKKKYSYICLLDNDILLEEDTIINLYKYIKENPCIGVVGSKICKMEDPEILQEMGSFIDFEESFNVRTPLKGHKDIIELPEIVKCDYVPACCLITTNEVLEKVGSFNTDHFIYWDDMDWCTRVKNAGWEVHAISSSRVFHKMGVVNHSNTFGSYYFERNRIMFFLKYLDEKKLDDFIQNICEWIVSLTYFSNLKKVYSVATSFLYALDDLLLEKLGKQDSSILKKEIFRDIYEKYSIDKKKKVLVYCDDSIEVNRKVLSYIKNDLNLTILLCLKKENIQTIKNNFHNNVITELKQNYEYEKTIIAVEHIISVNKSLLKDNKAILLDSYGNSCEVEELENIQKSYEIYKDIFNNIFKPLITKKIKLIRAKIKNEK